MLKNLLALLVSTVLTLAVVEWLIRRDTIPLPDHFESSGWWTEHWQRKHHGPQPNDFVKIDPLLGWVPAPNLDDYDYQKARLSTTADSLRGKRDYARGKSERTRIVAVGDSFMFGQCLDDEDTIPARLEALLPDTEVINLGVMGYGHGQMLARLRRDGFAYEPDVVLFGFYKPDMARNRLHFRDYAKPRFEIDDGELVLTHVPVPEPDEVDGWMRWPNYAGMLMDLLAKESNLLETRRLTVRIARAMEEDSAAAGARFALVYFPVRKEVTGGPIPFDLIAQECERNDWLCIGPGPRILKAIPNSKKRKKHFECHYSASLAQLIAEETAERLLESHPDLFR